MFTSSPTGCSRGLSAGALAIGALCSSVLAGPLRPVALTGTDGPLGPGLGPGVVFSTFQLQKTVHPEFGTYIPSAPSVSASGAVVFGATLTGSGIDVSNGTGIWAARGGAGPSLVARRGGAIPDQPGHLFGELFTAPQISGINTVVFQSMIDGADTTVGSDEGTFTERTGWVRTLIREGVTSVPEASPPTVFGLGGANPTGDPWGNNQWVLTRNGYTALRCFVDATGGGPSNNHFGVYTDFGGTLAKHYRGGDTYTDASATATFGGCTNPRLNDTGAFLTARLADPDTYGTLWSNRARDASGFGIPGTGPLHPIFLRGQTAPGTIAPFNSLFNGYGPFDINANGRVAFAADLGGGDIGAPGGVWTDGRFGVLQLLALSDAAAPGIPNEVFNSNAFFAMDLAMADNNVVVLKARLKPSAGVGAGNDIGLWTTRTISTGAPGTLRLAMRENDPVPTGLGPDYEGLNFGEPDQYWVNASGRIAFITLHNDFTRAVWIEQANGSFAPLVKEFTMFDVSGNGGDMRLIAEVDAAMSQNLVLAAGGTSDGRRMPFNDSGDFCVRLRFADGSEGIFTTAPAVACSGPTLGTPPAGQQVAAGGQATLSVAYTGTGPIRPQWRHNGVPIPGAIDSTLTLTNVQQGDTGSYDVVLTSSCGTATSSAASVTLATACAPDFDHSGTLQVQDIFDFLNAWFASAPAADFNHSGGLEVQDIFDFLNAWFAGC